MKNFDYKKLLIPILLILILFQLYQIHNLKSELEDLSYIVSRHQKNFYDLENKIEDSSNIGLEYRILDLESNIKNIKSDISDIEANIDNMQTDIDYMEMQRSYSRPF